MKLAAKLSLTLATLCLVASPAQADFLQYCRPDGRYSMSSFAIDNIDTPGLKYRVIEVNGLRILEGSGVVTEDSGTILQNAIRAGGAIDEVWFASGGGNVDGGLAMGRVLRENGLFVRIPAGYFCASSCSLAFLGGALRSVQGDYGIHMFSRYYREGNAEYLFSEMMDEVRAAGKIGGDKAAAEKLREKLQAEEQRNALTAAQLARYLVEMSASLEFLTGMFGWGHKDMCNLNEAGLRRYNVVNID